MLLQICNQHTKTIQITHYVLTLPFHLNRRLGYIIAALAYSQSAICHAEIMTFFKYQLLRKQIPYTATSSYSSTKTPLADLGWMKANFRPSEPMTGDSLMS